MLMGQVSLHCRHVTGGTGKPAVVTEEQLGLLVIALSQFCWCKMSEVDGDDASFLFIDYVNIYT
ncbi:hypothetical protein GCM10022296_03270 [Secundilactobacillus similis DSM 23365 = JCM 2765]